MAGDTTRLTIFIAGGYGIFGGRLARLLSGQPRLTLNAAGRTRAKAETFMTKAIRWTATSAAKTAV